MADDREDREKLFSYALRLFSIRLRTGKETLDKLWIYCRKKKFSESLVGETIERLTNLGYINDDNFARMWVQERRDVKNLSDRLIFSELTGKGIDKEIISRYLKSSGEDEFSRALSAVSRNKHKYTYLPAQVRRRRLLAFLMRKGYKARIAWKAVDEMNEKS